MTTLPRPTSAQGILPNEISAYNVCLRFEAHAVNSGISKDLMHAGVLGYLILFAPTLTARHQVVQVIKSHNEDYSTLSELGKAFIDYFILPFKKYSGRTSTPPSHPSIPSFDTTKAKLLASVREAPRDHAEAKRQALIRESYPCMVTGRYDARVPNPPLEQIKELGGAVYTECAHIVPDSTYFNVLGKSPHNKEYSDSVLAVLKRFGYNVDQLNGGKVHSLFNVMTMDKNVHELFDRLQLWLEATPTPSCYAGKTSCEMFVVPSGRVTFTTPDSDTLALPSPDLLALHAACAKVAHLLGAGEYADRVLEDMEEVRVLASDGSSSNILYHAILAGATRPISIVAH